jgi:Prealbumin-like fold domain
VFRSGLLQKVKNTAAAWVATVFLAVVALVGMVEISHSQTASVTATTNQTCAGTRFGSDLGCTANDFTSSLTFAQPTLTAISNCQAGQTININIIASITSGSTDRYDVGYFFGENGIDPQLNTAASSCSIGLFPTTPLPFFAADTPPDTCGDYKKSTTATLEVLGIRLLCRPATGTTALALPYVLSFKQNDGGNNCAVNGVNEIKPGTTSKCVSSANTSLTGVGTIDGVTVNGFVTLTKQTTPDTEPGTFAFTTASSPSATVTPATQNLVDGGSQTFQVPLVAGGTRQLVITETALGGWDPTASVTCTTPSGASSSAYVTVNNATRSITANLTETNYGALCTITNTKKPTVAVKKITTGDFGGPFAFAKSNLATAIADISTTVAATAQPASPTFHEVTTTNSDVTITETVHSDYVISTASCTDSNSSRTGNTGSKGTLSGNVLTIAGADVDPGSNYTCTFTNLKKPSLTVRAITNGGLATSTYTGSNGYAGDSILTTTIGTALAGTTDLLDNPTTATTVTAGTPTGYYLASASCTGMGAGGSASLSGAVLSINAAATSPGSNLVCTFTYDRLPLLTLVKTVTNDNGGTSALSAWTLTATGSTTTISGVTTASAVTSASLPVGTYALSESGPSGYAASAWSCTAGTLTGANLALTYNQDATCTINNNDISPVLTLVKTITGNTSPSSVPSFTLTATGPTTITGITGNAAVTAAAVNAGSYTLTETGPSGYVAGSWSCTAGSLSGNTLSLALGTTATCTINNVKLPTLTIRKISMGSTGTFGFVGTNGVSSHSIVTTSVAATFAATTDTLTAASAATQITETTPSSFWQLSSFACTGMGSGGTATLSGATVTLDVTATAPGSDITCTFTNSRRPMVSAQKITTGNFGGPFSFSSSNLVTTPANISTTAISTATPASPVQHLVTATGTAVGLTETFSTSWISSGVVCNDNNSAVTLNSNPVATSATGTVSIPAGAVVIGADINCLFTNAAAAPSLTIVKTANTAGPVAKNNVITYTFKIKNTGNVPISNVVVADSTNGLGTAPVPGSEAMFNNVSPPGDSSDSTANGTWDVLGPGDEIVFTAPYTVVQGDIDYRQ